MIDAVEFKKVVESYYNDFTQRYWDEEEGFKWKAVKAFSEKWDIDSSDFSAMLKAALKEAKPLLNMQTHFDRQTVCSANIYQIFTYVKNKEYELAKTGTEHKVSGMLLYAKTKDEMQPDGKYQMSGNKIIVRTLDLYQSFAEIRKELDGIVAEHF